MPNPRTIPTKPPSDMSKTHNKIFTNKQLQAAEDLSKNSNTEKQNNKTLKAFTRCLNDYGERVDFWNMSIEDLDHNLSRFYLGARKTKTGDYYKLNSMQAHKHSLLRILREKDYPEEIDDKKKFKKATKAWKSMSLDLKAMGLAETCGSNEITEEGKLLILIYLPNIKIIYSFHCIYTINVYNSYFIRFIRIYVYESIAIV